MLTFVHVLVIGVVIFVWPRWIFGRIGCFLLARFDREFLFYGPGLCFHRSFVSYSYLVS